MMPCNWDVIVPEDICSDWDDRPQATKDSALWLASTFLWAATGRRFGVCPVTVQPRQGSQCSGPGPAYASYEVAAGSTHGGLGVINGAFLFGGRWFNGGCVSCCSDTECAIVLRGPVAEIIDVIVDGVPVDASAYRVDVTLGTWLLVRTDGECWPACPRPDAGGEFEVTYGRGVVVPEALAIATAQLACEYGRLLGTGACKLPSRMTRLSRQGVDIELEQPPADGMLTGLTTVDAIITALNPSKLRQPPVILSPDLPGNCDRMTVIPGGS